MAISAGPPAAAALPGATIAQQAAAAKGGAGAASGHGAPKKVATALGSAFYKLPIGATIIPHPVHGAEPGGLKEHFIKGAPSHFDEGMSQATWVANQWKGHGTDRAFHEGLHSGTHKLVQAGKHEFAVHKDVDVHVPKQTDLSNPESVKNAPKLFSKKDQDGKPVEDLVFNPQHPAGSKPIEHNDAAADAKEKFWKPLHPAEAAEPEHKKPVAVDGKHAAFVPHDWQVFKAPGDDESQLVGKFAKDPGGNWHAVKKDGTVKPVGMSKESMEDWAAQKSIVPDDGKAAEHATLPPPGHKGPAGPTVGVPAKEGEPINVGKADIAKALAVLQEDKSTAVKQPLAKAGHPLAAMDYHQVAKDELAKHPELKVEPGSKKAHVGQVKLAVMHHLSGRAAHLAKTQAEEQVLQAAQDKAQAQAAHAAELTPHTFDVGGVTATKEQIQGAIDILNAKKNTLINSPLKHAGNPLGETDYWKVVNDYKAAHPNSVPQEKGTKQAHVASAKALFIAALQEKAGLLAKADQATGHDEAAARYDLAKNGSLKPGWEKSSDGAMAAAALLAVKYGATEYAYFAHAVEAYAVSPHKPTGGGFVMTVTPELKVTDSWGGDSQKDLAPALKKWLAPLKEPGAKPSAVQEPAVQEAPPDLTPPGPPPAPPAPPEPPPPELQGVPAVKDGIYVGDYPPGSQLYAKGYGEGTYAKALDGKWWYIAAVGVVGSQSGYQVKEAPSYYASDGMLASGQLKPEEPLTGPELKLAKQVGEAKKLVVTGAMSLDKSVSESGGTPVFPDKFQAMAYELSVGSKAKGNSDFSVVPSYGGFRQAYASQGDEHWSVSAASLEVTYHPPGISLGTPGPDPALQQELIQAVNANVVPGSVAVDKKLYQFGFHYSPKGKTYILIKPHTGGYAEYWKYGAAAYATYVYSDSSGQLKEVTPAFAAKQLAKATEFSDKPPAKEDKPLAKVSYASLYAPGTYKLWESDKLGVSTVSTVEVMTDGSAVLSTGASALPLGESTMGPLLTGGSVLDQFGNTVVKPGLQPDGYHIWGSQAKTPAQVKEMLDWLDGNPQEIAWSKKFQEFLGSDWSKLKGSGQAFMVNAGATDGAGQRAAVTVLLRELLAVPKLPADAKLGDAGAVSAPKGPVFLKEMPPGVTTSKDIFTYTAAGNVLPFQGSMPKFPSATSKPDLKAKIGEISQAFGGGSVVGTHLSALITADLITWVSAWNKGDMAAVFALDAKGGKVSPAHPGAPANADTNHVTWSAKDPNQVPAGQDIPGAWSDLATVSSLPPKEVDNYLIKMGFQHAEYLYGHEREQVVRSHRNHGQAAVDAYTGIVNDRIAQGAPPMSGPPAWTDGLKPAKAYDSVLQAGTPASEWPSKAVKAFVSDNTAAVMPYLDQMAQDQGFSGGGQYFIDNSYFSYLAEAVGSWQENEHAKEVAEKSVPVWAKVQADIKESHGHEIFKAAKTIPYTGEVTTYFVKPAPGGKQFRLEQEHAANLLGRLFGFQSAESLLLTDKAFGPEQVQAQKAVPGEALGFYTDMQPWSSFTGQQVADIAVEHLLDHVISNDDSSANNMIKTPAGRIVGIDKGRAWGDMSWQSLAGNSAMDSMTQLVYTKLYNGIRSHQITKDQADKAFLAVIARARKIQAVPDAPVAKLLQAGFAHRAKGSVADLIDETLRRKNSLVDDFTKMYEGIYKDAGIGPLPEVPAQAVPDMHGSPIHSGFSEPGFTDHVAQAKSHGVAAFFGGRQLRDMHVLVHRQKDSGGSTVTHGETFLRGAAYDKVIGWLKDKAGSAGSAASAAAEDTTASYPGDQYGPGKASGPDRGGVPGELNYYNSIIRAARSVTKHKSDGDYTSPSSQGILAALADTQQKLEVVKSSSEAALAKGNVLPEKVQYLNNGIDMAKQYLDHVAKVRAAKEGSFGFKEGDLPRWLPPKSADKAVPSQDELAALGIKLDYGAKAAHDTGTLDNGGEFVAMGSTHTDPGKYWRMTLPDGEQVFFGNSQASGVPVAHWGRIRFTTPHQDSASLERIRQALQLTGLDMNEAAPQDFELFYWRHLLSIMADRKDGKSQPVWPELKQQLAAHGLGAPMTHTAMIDALEKLGQADPQAEASAYRAAFAKLTGPSRVQEFADKGGFFPVQKHFDPRAPGVAGGKPDFYRFDISPADMPMPVRQSSNSTQVAPLTVKNGGSYGKDALMRVVGTLAGGLGNPYESGATSYVFTRLNITSERAIVFSPVTMARTRNYSYSSDFFGNQIPSDEGGYNEYSRAENAYWNPAKYKDYSGGSNETMISDALSFLDDVELVKASSPAQRDELVKYLNGLGITHVRHMAVEDRIVNHIGSGELNKVKANHAAHPELLDPFGQAGVQHAEPGPAQTAAEAKAETAALDTPPAAQAAEAGSTLLDSPSNPPTVNELLGKVMTASLGPGWKAEAAKGYSASEHWVGPNGAQIYKGKTTGKFLVYNGDPVHDFAALIGAYDTLQQAHDAAVTVSG